MDPRLRAAESRNARGFTLVELMVSVVVTGLALTGALTFFMNFQRVSRQQEQIRVLQTELRAAIDRMTSNLRRVDYGAPQTLLPTWVDWVSGFNTNPGITQGATSSDPDTISIAACTGRPVATVAATLSMGVGNNTVTLTSAVPGRTIAELLDVSLNRDLIRFVAGANTDAGFARVTAVSGTTVTIDTDPGTSGNQGFSTRDYFVGTPVCRVDVTTYALDTSTGTVTIDDHDGGGARPAFSGMTDLQVSGGGNVFNLEVAGETEQPDPVTGVPIPRRLAASITVRNQ